MKKWREKMKQAENKTRKTTAIIVRSPFQVICAIEAIQKFELGTPRFFVQGIDNSAKMSLDYIAEKGYQAIGVEETRNTIDAIRTYSHHEKYEKIIVGDYFSYGELILSSLWIESRGTIVYVDDGNSTLSMLPPTNLRRTTNWAISARKVFERILELNIRRKRINKLFFTIYDVEGRIPFNVVKNELSQLRREIRDGRQNGIYIIGTNSRALGWTIDEYKMKLKRIKEYAESRYKDQKIYFCPHRMDKNDNTEIAEELCIELFDTKVSVEVDFVTSMIFPKIVVGFGSTALLTLKKIYSGSDVVSIRFEGHDKIAESYMPIENEYKNNGIMVCGINEMSF